MSWRNVGTRCFVTHLGRSERSLVVELREVRNQWAHQEPFTSEDTLRALDSSYRLLIAVSAELQAEEIRKSRNEVLNMLARRQSHSLEQNEAITNEGFPSLGLKSNDKERSVNIAGRLDKSVSSVVIVCAACKRSDAGSMRLANGKLVRFLANPGAMPVDAIDANYVYARPDDISDSGASWRDLLQEYNREYERIGANPNSLLPAYKLYSNSIYRELVNWCGLDRVFILSGGWGLISAAFLTPQYDITFSPNAEKWKRRGKRDRYSDACHIPEEFGGTIEFFGGKKYAGFFADLTRSLDCRKIVRYNSATRPSAPGCELRRYSTRAMTNWYYQCAKKLIDGELDN